VVRALQAKYAFSVNEAALDKAVESAKAVRAGADSARAQQGPPAGAPAGDSVPKAP
jgi:hypothetical protein